MSYRTAALTYAAVLFGFKIWSFILIYLFAGESGAVGFILGTHVLWLAIPILLFWAPGLFWFRVLRVRRRRVELQQSEWYVDQKPPAQH